MIACPCCGAENRLGVWLPRMKVRILDLIQRRGGEGISSRELCGDSQLIEASTHKRLSVHTIKMHVHQLNERLVETDFKIISVRGGRVSTWHLMRTASNYAVSGTRQTRI